MVPVLFKCVEFYTFYEYTLVNRCIVIAIPAREMKNGKFGREVLFPALGGKWREMEESYHFLAIHIITVAIITPLVSDPYMYS